jgi:hypothetical protein
VLRWPTIRASVATMAAATSRAGGTPAVKSLGIALTIAETVATGAMTERMDLSSRRGSSTEPKTGEAAVAVVVRAQKFADCVCPRGPAARLHRSRLDTRLAALGSGSMAFRSG